MYTSTHLSLAFLEYLVHVDPDNLPEDLVWLKIEILDNHKSEIFLGNKVPNPTEAAAYGDDWLETTRSLTLVVPSTVLYVEKNVIINPRHKEMSKVKLLEEHKFEFDERLLK